MEKMHPVGLNHLTHVHHFPEKLCRARQLQARNAVAGLGGRQMVAYGTDPAYALGNLRHLQIGTTLAELFQPAELVYVEKRLIDLALIVQMDRDPAMTLDACDRFNGYLASSHSYLL
jgi:hypothetical protein